MVRTPLTITVTKNSVKVNKSDVGLDKIFNLLLNAASTLALNTINCKPSDPEHTKNMEEKVFEMYSQGFANVLGHIAPELYFGSEEDLLEEMAAEERDLAERVANGEGADLDFDEIKEVQMAKIEEARQFREEHPELFEV